ncbi:MAG TPA: glycosyltransferase family 29 protein, partial [Acidobacteriota bacterium]
VGNANYLLETEVGAEIDAHDVIIRFNKGFVVSPAAQGSRTSIHCLATNVPLNDLKIRVPTAHLLYVSPVRSYLAHDLRDVDAPCTCIPLSDWKQLSLTMGGLRPSAGLIVIDFLLNRATTNTISIYGFDWKRTKSFYHKTKIKDWHSGEAERQILLQWAAKEPGRINFGNCPMGEPD